MGFLECGTVAVEEETEALGLGGYGCQKCGLSSAGVTFDPEKSARGGNPVFVLRVRENPIARYYMAVGLLLDIAKSS